MRNQVKIRSMLYIERIQPNGSSDYSRPINFVYTYSLLRRTPYFLENF